MMTSIILQEPDRTYVIAESGVSVDVADTSEARRTTAASASLISAV